ncbi:hypothetical protein [Burkholderia sp. BCC0419]|uniref:hypothetical protein n=1 Tax=Burkholderia sp. BCC0419 TaxID=486878 RepID=UPI001589373F|nr:hypothetical protein [Burkholderia sp. BCC0419]
MIELAHDRNGVTFIFDGDCGQHLLAAIGTWDGDASINVEAFDRRAGRSIELGFCFGTDDCIEFRPNGIVLTLSREASDYAAHKRSELLEMNGFSTPEFWQFDHPKKTRMPIDTFFIVTQ